MDFIERCFLYCYWGANLSFYQGIPLEEAKKITADGGGEIYIRQVTSMSRTLEVRERMKKRYSFRDYPDEFKYRCKCIIVFQNLDGVDTILFGLYVYEHDETNAPPNQRAVYISYLDSVYYMRPRRMRTFVYHELLISYLDYVRGKGYNTAHIWACPPLKGDDYILFAKPEDQKTPKDDRLRQWYVDMLKDCQRRGIVGRVTNAYDLYFSDKKNDASILPYMEGDYFPAELENIIKDLEEGKNLSKKPDKSASKKGKKEKSKTKKAGSRGGTRSAGLDEDALAASGILGEGVDVASLKAGGRDAVMKKLGETIHPMKDSFLVAFLNWDGAKEENKVVPNDVIEYRKQHGIGLPMICADPESKQESDGKPAADSPALATIKEESGAEENKEAAFNKPSESATTSANETKEEHAAKEGELVVKEEEKADPSTADNATPGEEKKEEPSKEELSKEEPPKEESSKEEPTEAADEPSDEKSEPVVKEDKDDDKETSEEPKVEETSKSEAALKEEKPKKDENGDVEMQDAGSTSKSNETDAAKNDAESKDNELEGAEPKDVPSTDAAGSTEVEVKEEPPTTSEEAKKEEALKPESPTKREGKFAAMEARKKDLQVEAEPEKSSSASDQAAAEKKSLTKDSKGRLVKVIDDDEEELDCEFLNNRQLFLNLCQGNHYQFDQLRRAKHTSMMVLWHLHNRDAPKFVQQCAVCSREILQGMRYHCPTCADFDQCYECMSNPNVPRHQHPLKAISVAGSQQASLTPEQRKERQRSIQLHMTLLLHAATCKSSKCASANCAKMKGLLKHGSQCQIKAAGGCHVCKRIWALLQIHARQCKQENCVVPNCLAIRERFRQLNLQQQAMDDRRRQMMNQTYHQQGR